MNDLLQRLNVLKKWFRQDRREQQRSRTHAEIDATFRSIDKARTYGGRLVSNFRVPEQRS